MSLGSYLIPYTEINLECIKDLNGKARIIKLIKENLGESLHDIGFCTLWIMTPKAWARREKLIGLHQN